MLCVERRPVRKADGGLIFIFYFLLKHGQDTAWRETLMTQQNKEEKLGQQQHNTAGVGAITPGASPAPRVEGDETRDVLTDEVSPDEAVTEQQRTTGDAQAPAGERSESLLPKVEGDETRDVAEEVSLDQQSDRVRELGNLPADGGKTPAGSVAGAVADSLAGKPAPRK